MVDDSTGKNIGRGELPQTACNFAIENGMPQDQKQPLIQSAQQQQADQARAESPTTNVPDANTNATTRPLTQTQATSGQTEVAKEPVPAPAATTFTTTDAITTGTAPAAASARDDGTVAPPRPAPTNTTVLTSSEDAGNPTRTKTQATTDNAKNLASQLITPKGNVLDRFANYTYRASVYLLTPSQYRQLISQNKKSVGGYNLLFQSGGASKSTAGFQGALSNGQTSYERDGASTSTTSVNNQSSVAGRNPAFDVDFYIDSITLETLQPGRSTRSVHSAATLKFTVVEPNGITLLDRLYEAVQDHAPRGAGGGINYSAAAYLMVIRFYGYDENGNLIPGLGGADPATGNTDPSAVIEKFIPFKIAKINWGVSSKLITYDFECLPYGQSVAASTGRGTVPYDVQLNEITVGQLLGGDVIYSSETSEAANPGANTTTNRNFNQPKSTAGTLSRETDSEVASLASRYPPPKSIAARSAKTSIKQGLMAALNNFQQSLCTGANAVYQVPDEYRIVFAAGSEDIENAALVLPGKKKESAQTSMAAPVSQNPSNVSQSKISKDTTTRNFSITAGMQVIQAIELAIRNSSYVYNQATTQIDAVSDEELAKQSNGKQVQWFNVTFTSEPIEPYDELRNDYAQRVTFIVSKYGLSNYESKYFAPPRYQGVHKSYPYWFTGKNTQVLDYQENLNSLYNITVSGSNPKNSQAEQQRRRIIASQRDQPTFNYQSASGESRQGSEIKGNEVAASIADSLYSPGDLATTKLRIVGDPAWIQQGSMAGGVRPETFNYGPFNPDGTINFDSQQVMFEVVWARPDDYDVNSGIMNPNAGTALKKKQTVASRIYNCRKVTHEFKNGKFEQIIDGNLFLYLKPDATNKAATAPVPSPIDQNSDTVRVGLNEQLLSDPSRLSAPVASSLNVPSLASGGGINGVGAVGGSGTVTQLAGLAQSSGLMSNPNILKTAASYGRAISPMLSAPPVMNYPQLGPESLASTTSLGPNFTVGFPTPPQLATSGFGGGEEVVGTLSTDSISRLISNSNVSQANAAIATNIVQLMSREF